MEGDESMKIVKYSDNDFQPLIEFMEMNWAPKHAIYDKALFDWQYRIHEGNLIESLLLKDDGVIVGFLGVIPGNYVVDGEVCRGSGLAMWVVQEKYRTSGLGVLLLKETEKTHPVTLTLGCNLQVAPIYQRMGYSYSTHLNRYVLPLCVEGYVKLLKNPVDSLQIKQWVDDVERLLTISLSPNKEITSLQLEALFKESLSGRFSFYQHRDSTFWQWRYIHSVGYSYVLFGDPMTSGVAVVRIDHVFDPENESLHGLKVLRIIELIPKKGEVWAGEDDYRFTDLILGVLAWAKQSGCVAADYQISNLRLHHILHHSGFRIQYEDYTPDENGLAGLFQPFRYHVNPINMVWKTKNANGEPIQIELEDTYFVKSDGDMDRPNIWPLPQGRDFDE